MNAVLCGIRPGLVVSTAFTQTSRLHPSAQEGQLARLRLGEVAILPRLKIRFSTTASIRVHKSVSAQLDSEYRVHVILHKPNALGTPRYP